MIIQPNDIFTMLFTSLIEKLILETKTLHEAQSMFAATMRDLLEMIKPEYYEHFVGAMRDIFKTEEREEIGLEDLFESIGWKEK